MGMRSATGAPSPTCFAVAHSSWGVSAPVGEGLRDGFTPLRRPRPVFVRTKQGWVVVWTQMSTISGSLTARDASLLILTRISHLFLFHQRCLGDNKRVPLGTPWEQIGGPS